MANTKIYIAAPIAAASDSFSVVPPEEIDVIQKRDQSDTKTDLQEAIYNIWDNIKEETDLGTRNFILDSAKTVTLSTYANNKYYTWTVSPVILNRPFSDCDNTFAFISYFVDDWTEDYPPISYGVNIGGSDPSSSITNNHWNWNSQQKACFIDSGYIQYADNKRRYWYKLKSNGYTLTRYWLYTDANHNPTVKPTIYNVMLSFGSGLADWTPAPEDVEDYVDKSILSAKSAVTKTLTVQRGGTSVGTYNGTADKTINITLPSFSEVTSKPTTLSGYGITDAYTKTTVDSNVATCLTNAKTYTNNYATPLTCLRTWYAYNGSDSNIGWKICTLTLNTNAGSPRAVLMISGKVGWNNSNSGAIYMFQLSQNYSSSDGQYLGISGSLLVNGVDSTSPTAKQWTNNNWRLIAKRIAQSKYELYWVYYQNTAYVRFHFHFFQTNNWTVDTTCTSITADEVPEVDGLTTGVMQAYIARTPDANNYGAMTGASITNSGLVKTATLNVTGASTLTGAVTAGSTITATGNIVSKAAITAYQSSASDKRLKKEIHHMDDAMEMIKRLNPVRFKWNDKASKLTNGKISDGDDGVGFIAQEAQVVNYPELVFNMPGCDYLGMRYEKIVPALVGAVQQLSAEVEQLKKQLNG